MNAQQASENIEKHYPSTFEAHEKNGNLLFKVHHSLNEVPTNEQLQALKQYWEEKNKVD